jgi:hypothetical protein
MNNLDNQLHKLQSYKHEQTVANKCIICKEGIVKKKPF